jgi:hypothetical protein
MVRVFGHGSYSSGARGFWQIGDLKMACQTSSSLLVFRNTE